MTGRSPSPREFADIGVDIVLDQPGDRETLAAAEADRRLGAAHGERRYLQIADPDCALGRELTDLGPHLDRDPVGRQYRRNKIEPHAERLELDRDRVAVAAGIVLRDRDRELAAGQKTGGLARDRRQVGLREDRDEALLGQRVDDIVDVYTARVHAPQRQVGNCRLLAQRQPPGRPAVVPLRLGSGAWPRSPPRSGR